MKWTRQFSPFSVAPILSLHFKALRPPRSSKLTGSSKYLLIVLPIMGGIGMGLWVHWGLSLHDGVSQVIAGTALLVGAMLSAFIFLTNLRVKVQESATFAFRSNLQKLIGGAAVGCLYVAGVTMLLAAMLAAVATFSALRSPEVRPFAAAFIVAVAIHLLVNLLSVVRRLFGIYFDIFASDFSDDIDSIEPGRNEPTQTQKHSSSLKID